MENFPSSAFKFPRPLRATSVIKIHQIFGQLLFSQVGAYFQNFCTDHFHVVSEKIDKFFFVICLVLRGIFVYCSINNNNKTTEL